MGWLFGSKKPKETPEPKQDAVPELARTQLSYRGASLQGIGARSEQQDAFDFVNIFDVTLIQEQGILAIVADGMGGMEGGAFAAQTAVACVRDAFLDMDRESSVPEQLEAALRNADEVIYHGLLGAGGSTAVVGMVYQEKFWFACVGDSYLYLKRGSSLIRLNRPQNVEHDLYLESIRQGNVSREAAEASGEREAVSQFLGMGELTDTDSAVRPLRLQDGDVLLLCSDGVAGVMTEEDILFALARPVPQEMCADLERTILQKKRKYQDNYTALIIQCTY